MQLLSLKAARVNAGLTQEEAAARLGINRNTLQRWERGQTFPRIDQVKKLACIYDTNEECINFFAKK